MGDSQSASSIDLNDRCQYESAECRGCMQHGIVEVVYRMFLQLGHCCIPLS